MTIQKEEVQPNSMQEALPEKLLRLMQMQTTSSMKESDTKLRYVFEHSGKQTVLNYRQRGVTEAMSHQQGELVPHIESWEYRRNAYWRKAIDGLSSEERERLVFEPTSIQQLCEDISNHDAASLFNPNIVVNTILKVSSTNLHDYLGVVSESRNKISSILEKHIVDYKPYFQQDGSIRFVPTTQLGRESIIEDNEAYENLKKQMPSIIEELKQAFLGDRKIAPDSTTDPVDKGNQHVEQKRTDDVLEEELTARRNLVEKWMKNIKFDVRDTVQQAMFDLIKDRLTRLAVYADLSKNQTIWEIMESQVPQFEREAYPKEVIEAWQAPLTGTPVEVLKNTRLVIDTSPVKKSFDRLLSVIQQDDNKRNVHFRMYNLNELLGRK